MFQDTCPHERDMFANTSICGSEAFSDVLFDLCGTMTVRIVGMIRCYKKSLFIIPVAKCGASEVRPVILLGIEQNPKLYFYVLVTQSR